MFDYGRSKHSVSILDGTLRSARSLADTFKITSVSEILYGIGIGLYLFSACFMGTEILDSPNSILYSFVSLLGKTGILLSCIKVVFFTRYKK
jgi:hypothetical protein